MTVGIIGLGLIGGSMAKAYRENSAHTVLGTDIDASLAEYACIQGALHGLLTEDRIASCDLIFLAIYPQAAIQTLQTIAPQIRSDTVVIDLCGTKRTVCEAGFALASQYGFTFIGGHPMAGTHNSGFKYARADLFHGAPMVLVPPHRDDIFLLDRLKQLLSPAGFGRLTVTSAEQHDAIIAFTSQLAHVVSNAYVKSPTATQHKGFSAGSYKDLTRVAWLNAPMWTELFLDNRDYLTGEIDGLIHALQEYRDALQTQDAETLCRLLEDGKRRKEEVG